MKIKLRSSRPSLQGLIHQAIEHQVIFYVKGTWSANAAESSMCDTTLLSAVLPDAYLLTVADISTQSLYHNKGHMAQASLTHMGAGILKWHTHITKCSV